jgi:hypothetical protein
MSADAMAITGALTHRGVARRICWQRPANSVLRTIAGAVSDVNTSTPLSC